MQSSHSRFRLDSTSTALCCVSDFCLLYILLLLVQHVVISVTFYTDCGDVVLRCVC